MNNRGKRRSAGAWSVLCALLAGIAVWLAATAFWEARNWSDLKMEEVVYQLTTLEGVGGHMVTEYLLTAVLPGLAAAVGVGAVLFLLKNLRVARVGTLCALCAIAALAVYGWKLLDVGEYLANINTESEYIQHNYADPAQVEPVRERPPLTPPRVPVKLTFSSASRVSSGMGL